MYKWAALPIAVLAGFAVATSGSAGRTVAASSASGTSPVKAFDLLPDSDFPATVLRGHPRESGTLTFRFSFLGHATTLTASTTSVSAGQLGTLSRSPSEFVLHFTRLHYGVAPITLPNGLVLASQTITLNPKGQNTLRIDRHTGAVTADLHWVVSAPNALYNGSQNIEFADTGRRRIASFKQVGAGRYSFNIRSEWHGSVTLAHWSVAGQELPGGAVTLEGVWNGHYDLDVKRAG